MLFEVVEFVGKLSHMCYVFFAFDVIICVLSPQLHLCRTSNFIITFLALH
jgi:hypothetical protein